MNVWSGRYAARMRELVRETYGEVCWLCGKSIPEGAFSVDHVIPRSRGGGDEIENLRPAHGRCNSRRGNRGIVRPISPTSREW
jgi:5-methylcytosine-specific restriction endonuclease McrA